MSEWKEYKLSDFIEINPKVTLKSGTKYSFVEMKDLSESQKFVLPSQLIEIKGGARFQNFDTLFARITPCLQNGKICQVKGLKNSIGFGSTEFLVFRGKEGISNTDFVYYLSRYDIVRKFAEQNMIGTSGRQRVSKDAFENIELFLPDLPTQTAIAEILSSLDDKIELNNKINQELENLAQTFFKQWFIDFEFPNQNGEPYKSSGGEMVDSELGEIPEGWEVKRLSEIVKLTGGGTPKRSEDKYWNGKISWFSVQDVPSNSDVIVIETKEKITLEGLNNSSTKILPIGTTIITARGTVGKLAFVASPMAMNQSCYGVNGNDSIGPIFNYLNLFKSIDELKRNTHGAVFDTITSSTFETIKTLLPESSILNKFEITLNPLFSIFVENVKENIELSNLRDTLLPKLISGELEINEISK